MAGGTATPETIAIAERRHMALDMRRRGGSYRQIADSLRKVEGIPPKYSHAQAQRDVTDELRKYNEANRESVAILKRLELERLDDLWRTYWTPAIGGDIAAAGYLLKLMERRARLEGLDAPTAMKHSGDAENPVAVKARSFTIRIDRRADDGLLDTLDTLETAGAVPVGTVTTIRAALVALHPELDAPVAGLLDAQLSCRRRAPRSRRRAASSRRQAKSPPCFVVVSSENRTCFGHFTKGG